MIVQVWHQKSKDTPSPTICQKSEAQKIELIMVKIWQPRYYLLNTIYGSGHLMKQDA